MQKVDSQPEASQETSSLNYLLDSTIAALPMADAGRLAEVLHLCRQASMPGPGMEWGLAVEKRRILAALLKETGRNLRLLHQPKAGENYTRDIGRDFTGNF